jgi:hypothetical protein
VLCTLLFEDGTWTTAPAAARTATLRLLKNGRALATGKALLKAGRLQVRLRNTRAVRPGSYRLAIKVPGKQRTVNARVHAAAPRT